MNITPTSDLLIIRRIKEEEPKTSWGLLLPPSEEQSETPYKGVVLFAGNGRRPKVSRAGRAVVEALQGLVDSFHAMPNVNWGARGFSITKWGEAEEALKAHAELPEVIPMSVRVGDVVIFSRHGYQEFRVNGEDVIVTQEASIIGVLDHIAE